MAVKLDNISISGDIRPDSHRYTLIENALNEVIDAVNALWELVGEDGLKELARKRLVAQEVAKKPATKSPGAEVAE